MKLSKHLLRPNTILVSLLISILWPTWLAAQLAGIVGSVSDPSGAAIGGATIRATNTNTGLEWQAKTGPQGDYSLGLLPPGVYGIEATAAGFAPARAAGVQLLVNATSPYRSSAGAAGGQGKPARGGGRRRWSRPKPPSKAWLSADR